MWVVARALARALGAPPPARLRPGGHKAPRSRTGQGVRQEALADGVDLGQLADVDHAVVGKVKAQALGLHHAALLAHMVAQHLRTGAARGGAQAGTAGQRRGSVESERARAGSGCRQGTATAAQTSTGAAPVAAAAAAAAAPRARPRPSLAQAALQ